MAGVLHELSGLIVAWIVKCLLDSRVGVGYTEKIVGFNV